MLNHWANISAPASFIIYAVAVFGGWLMLVVLLVQLFRRRHHRHIYLTVIIASLSAILAFFLADSIKNIFPVTRPYVALADIKAIFIPIGASSFPSGHAAFFGALAFATYFGKRLLGLWLIILALLVCIARIASGIHYPLDIFAGLLIGLVSAWVMVKLVGFIRSRKV